MMQIAETRDGPQSQRAYQCCVCFQCIIRVLPLPAWLRRLHTAGSRLLSRGEASMSALHWTESEGQSPCFCGWIRTLLSRATTSESCSAF